MESGSESDEDILLLAVSTALLVHRQKTIQQRRRRKRRFYVHPKNLTRSYSGFLQNYVLKMDNIDPGCYTDNFRMTKATFDHLLSLVRRRLKHAPTHRMPISAAERLALTLKFLSSGDSSQTVAWMFRIARETALKILDETCGVLWDVLFPLVLSMPTEEEWRIISAEFFEKTNFPLLLGAVDGKHIWIKAPKKSGGGFRNYKKTFSINLMAVADSRYRFVYVDVGAYGRQGDAGVYGLSSFGRALNDSSNPLKIPTVGQLPGTDQPFPYVFVGDAAFPIGPHMLKPYASEELSMQKRIFNYRLSRARRCVEQAFGLLVARWQIFRKPLTVEPEIATKVTQAAVALHNFLIQRGEETELTDEHGLRSLGDVLGGGGSTAVGNRIRDRLATWFSSDADGARLPWQDAYVRRGE